MNFCEFHIAAQVHSNDIRDIKGSAKQSSKWLVEALKVKLRQKVKEGCIRLDQNSFPEEPVSYSTMDVRRVSDL